MCRLIIWLTKWIRTGSGSGGDEIDSSVVGRIRRRLVTVSSVSLPLGWLPGVRNGEPVRRQLGQKMTRPAAPKSCARLFRYYWRPPKSFFPMMKMSEFERDAKTPIAASTLSTFDWQLGAHFFRSELISSCFRLYAWLLAMTSDWQGNITSSKYDAQTFERNDARISIGGHLSAPISRNKIISYELYELQSADTAR